MQAMLAAGCPDSSESCDYRSERVDSAAGSLALRGGRPMASDIDDQSVLKQQRPHHPMALQNIVGERVPQHYRCDLFDAAHRQTDQIPIAPTGMNAFADAALLILRLP